MFNSSRFNMKSIPIAFTEEQYKKLKIEKSRTGCSMAAIIRLALEEYFSRKFRKGVLH